MPNGDWPLGGSNAFFGARLDTYFEKTGKNVHVTRRELVRPRQIVEKDLIRIVSAKYCTYGDDSQKVD